MTDTSQAKNECQATDGSYPDHDFWDDGHGYQCRRCDVALDELEDEATPMTVKKPRKPWRVIITGPDVRAESEHTSEVKAYALVRAALGGDSAATQARIEYWEDGLWRWFETVEAEDVP